MQQNLRRNHEEYNFDELRSDNRGRNGSACGADVVIDIVESGTDILATLSGSLDLDATDSFSGGGFLTTNSYFPTLGNISFGGDTGFGDGYFFSGTPSPFGSGGFDIWGSSSGDEFDFNTAAPGFLIVPTGYVSGQNLSGSTIKFNSDFVTEGFLIGTYVTTLTGPSGVSDTVTINVGIPEPTAFGILGLFGLTAATRRR